MKCYDQSLYEKTVFSEARLYRLFRNYMPQHPIYTSTSNHWGMVSTIHQSPLGYVSYMVTYMLPIHHAVATILQWLLVDGEKIGWPKGKEQIMYRCHHTRHCILDVCIYGHAIIYQKRVLRSGGGGQNFFKGPKGGAKIFSRGQRGGQDFFKEGGPIFFAPPAQFTTYYNVKKFRAFGATFPNIFTYTSLNFTLASLSHPFLCATSPLPHQLFECWSSPNDLLNPLTPFKLIRAYAHDENMKA